MAAPPGKGLFGWLGRQVGHVAKAVRTDVSAAVVHRSQQVQEQPHPTDPAVTLRRTTTDEVIVRRSPETEAQAGPEVPRRPG